MPDDYNPRGALGDLFAPAFIRGNPQSEQAVLNWQAEQRPVTSNIVDQLRMPNPPPTAGTLSFGDPRGMVDINALRAASQGTPYDIDARRNAIANTMVNTSAGAGGTQQLPANVGDNSVVIGPTAQGIFLVYDPATSRLVQSRTPNLQGRI